MIGPNMRATEAVPKRCTAKRATMIARVMGSRGRSWRRRSSPFPRPRRAPRSPYTEFQALLDPTAPPGWRWYNTGEHLSGLTDQAIDVLTGHAPQGLAPLSRSLSPARRRLPQLQYRGRGAPARRLWR